MDTPTSISIEARAISILKLAVRRPHNIEELRMQTADLQTLLAEAARQQRVNQGGPSAIVVPLTR
jgi:hypothetical protein